jgi:hypothetical protein
MASCRMGTDVEAVVDSEARMKSVRRIRIVDASIMPRIITGNLNAPVMMMAEKLSDRIRGKPLSEPSWLHGWKATASSCHNIALGSLDHDCDLRIRTHCPDPWAIWSSKLRNSMP